MIFDDWNQCFIILLNIIIITVILSKGIIIYAILQNIRWSGMQTWSVTLGWLTWPWMAEASPIFSPQSHRPRSQKLLRWLHYKHMSNNVILCSPRSQKSQSRPRSQRRKRCSSSTDFRGTSWRRRPKILCWTPARTLSSWQWFDSSNSVLTGAIQRYSSATSGGG